MWGGQFPRHAAKIGGPHPAAHLALLAPQPPWRGCPMQVAPPPHRSAKRQRTTTWKDCGLWRGPKHGAACCSLHTVVVGPAAEPVGSPPMRALPPPTTIPGPVFVSSVTATGAPVEPLLDVPRPPPCWSWMGEPGLRSRVDPVPDPAPFPDTHITLDLVQSGDHVSAFCVSRGRILSLAQDNVVEARLSALCSLAIPF